MSANTAIEWCTHTFNPWWGCTKVSPACTNCYAATFAKRFGAEWGPKARRRFFGEAKWREPLKWNAQAEREGVRARVFCASMADVFEQLCKGHPDCDAMFNAREQLWDLIEHTPWLDWLLLTKRPENVRTMVPPVWWGQKFPANVWLGVSVEDQRRADERIPHLLQTPAAVRFLSMEPLLGPVALGTSLQSWLVDHRCYGDGSGVNRQGFANRVDWVITGGESGPGARPSHPDWFRSIRDQCVEAGVAFHFKQWGDWLPFEPDGQAPFWVDQAGNTWDGHALNMLDPESGELFREWHPDSEVGPCAWRRVGKKNAGRQLDGRTWDQFPEVLP